MFKKIALGVLLSLGFSYQATAGVTYASEGGNTIRVGFNNGASILDVTGDGIPEIGQLVLSKSNTIATLVGVGQKIKEINYVIPRFTNSVTGIGKNFQGGSHVLIYGFQQSTWSSYAFNEWGQGTFSQAGSFFVVDMQSASSSGLFGATGKFIAPDEALSVIIWNGVTGKRVRQFSLHSGASWILIPEECGFVDTDGNGTVEFVERWEKRPPVVTGPVVTPTPGTVVTSRGKTMWVIWNSNRTKRIKTTYVTHTNQTKY